MYQEDQKQYEKFCKEVEEPVRSVYKRRFHKDPIPVTRMRERNEIALLFPSKKEAVPETEINAEMGRISAIANEIFHTVLYALTDVYYDDFPYVCYESTKYVSDFILNQFQGEFLVYDIFGDYKKVGHWWTMVYSMKTGQKYYIDFTKIQFMSKYYTEETTTGPDGQPVVHKDYTRTRGRIMKHAQLRMPSAVTHVRKGLSQSGYKPERCFELL